MIKECIIIICLTGNLLLLLPFLIIMLMFFYSIFLQCDIYTNQSSVLIFALHHEVCTAGALEAQVYRTSAFRAPAGKPELCMADYVNTRGEFCIYYTPNLKYPLITV